MRTIAFAFEGAVFSPLKHVCIDNFACLPLSLAQMVPDAPKAKGMKREHGAV